MKEEQLITFETAKLAQDKGYNERQIYFFNEGSNWKLQSDPILRTGKDMWIECPSQSSLQKWLREKHNIVVTVKPHFYNIRPPYKVKYEYVIFVHGDNREFDTYEEALEIGLQEGLSQIQM